METVFTLMMPPGVRVKDLSQSAPIYPKGIPAGGHRAALLAGAVTCACASLSSSFVKARPQAGAEPGGGML